MTANGARLMTWGIPVLKALAAVLFGVVRRRPPPESDGCPAGTGRHRILFDGADNGIVVLDEYGIIQAFNPAAEAALRAAKEEAERASLAKSRFLAAASHDLRQPFQAMRLLHHLLMSRLAGDAERQIAVRLGESLEAGARLLDALLDVSILEAGAVVPRIDNVPLRDLLACLARAFEPEAAGKALRLTVVPSAQTVRSDPVLLARMIRNLLANALRHAGRGRILLGCRRAGAGLRIEVWDTGPGIPADQLEAIFGDFHQLGNPERSRAEGFGLGLPIVRRTARLLGHPVSVRSWPGKGSVFAITVPRVITDHQECSFESHK